MNIPPLLPGVVIADPVDHSGEVGGVLNSDLGVLRTEEAKSSSLKVYVMSILPSNEGRALAL